jgi:hypothetical protein
MAIARDATSAGESSGANSLTFSHTNTGSNLALFVGVMCRDGDNVTGVTYGGVAMTQLLKRTNTSTYYIYGLVAPATGANNVVISRSTTTDNLVGISVSYTGVHQGLSLNHSTAGADISAAASFALNITTTVNNAWALAFFRADNANNNIAAGTGEYLVNTYGDSTTKRQGLIDTDGVIATAGTEELNATFPAGSNGSVIAVSFLPAGLDTGLVSYYKLDESSGNADDAVGVNDLTNNNTVGYTTGKINNGADFGSANSSKFFSYDAGNMWNGTSGSISCWVNVTTAPASGERQMIAVLGDSSSDTTIHINYKNESGTLKLEFDRFKRPSDGSDPTVSADYTLTTGTWYFLTITYASNVIRGYVNGTQVGTATGAGGNGSSLTTGNRIGAWLGNTEYFKGLVDEVGIWSRALSADEVEELYNDDDGKQYPFSGTAYSLACDVGAFTLTGIDIGIQKALNLTAEVGEFVLTGIDVALKNGKGIVCEVGNFILSGKDALLKFSGWTTTTKHSSTFTNQSKNTSTFTNQSKSSSSWTNQDKS